MAFHSFRLTLDGAELVDQTAATDPQLLGGLGAVSVAFFQRGQDGCSLDLGELACLGILPIGPRHVAGDLGREVFGHDDVAAAYETRQLDGIAKLPDITWPRE